MKTKRPAGPLTPPRNRFRIDTALRRLKNKARNWNAPLVSQAARRGREPFRVLISTILSSRTKDQVTSAASNKLFALADTPRGMVSLTQKQIEKAIYPAGFYRNKAASIRKLSNQLIEQSGGEVPSDLPRLLSLPGVGRKTANLVLSWGCGIPAICVDTHVNRISNRWGYVRTKTPAETEKALRKKLPQKYWIDYNGLLVAFGQNVCQPASPKCSECVLSDMCPKINVRRAR